MTPQLLPVIHNLRELHHLHGYQQRAVNHQCSMPYTMLWLDVGLGKTAVTLTSIWHLIQTGYLTSVVIVAPIKVMRLVWRQEAKKWKHTEQLTFSMLSGTRDQRTRALLQPANIYLINYENLGWLSDTLHTYFISRNRPVPFNGIVWDEVNKCKNSTTNRVKSVMKILPAMQWSTGLTATPASNGYKDLHGQYLVVDKGQRLGVHKTKFKHEFYKKIEGDDYLEVPFEDTETRIRGLIGDITLEMSAADYNPLPDLIVNDIEVELPPELRARYDQMEKDFFIRLDSGREKEMFNKASLTNSCLQFSNGAMYPIAGLELWEPVHELKLEALDDLVDESQGNQILCGYAFKSDAARIMDRFKHLDPINLTACKTDRALNEAMRRWKAHDCQLMIGHPLSMGHGVDGLQDAGHIAAWYGLTWSLDLYIQFNGRLRRQGQGRPVTCHRIMCRDTMDQAQSIALGKKADTESSLRNAVKEYRIMRGL